MSAKCGVTIALLALIAFGAGCRNNHVLPNGIECALVGDHVVAWVSTARDVTPPYFFPGGSASKTERERDYIRICNLGKGVRESVDSREFGKFPHDEAW